MLRMCFDAELLRNRIRKSTQLARSRNLAWRPQLPRQTPVEFCALCRKHGAPGISVSTISEAQRLAESDISSILITLPPAFSELRHVRRIPQTTELLFTVDHFVQVERIASQDQSLRNGHRVLILIQTDKRGPGIRPGPDALRLAQGVSLLPGIQVVGITAGFSSAGYSRPVINSVRHTQQQFREVGICCDLVSVAGTADDFAVNGSVVTEIRDRTLLRTTGRERPLVWLEAEVISRPSLEFAVISGGPDLWGWQTSLWLPDFPDAQVSNSNDGCCVVKATGTAQQLKIGDVVRVARTDSTK